MPGGRTCSVPELDRHLFSSLNCCGSSTLDTHWYPVVIPLLNRNGAGSHARISRSRDFLFRNPPCDFLLMIVLFRPFDVKIPFLVSIESQTNALQTSISYSVASAMVCNNFVHQWILLQKQNDGVPIPTIPTHSSNPCGRLQRIVVATHPMVDSRRVQGSTHETEKNRRRNRQQAQEC